MSVKSFQAIVCSLLGATVLCATGCFSGFTTQGPSIGLLSIPIPVSPYLQDEQEDKHWERERYSRVPILGPLTAGGPAKALDTPSDDEVIVAWEKANPVEGGVPFLFEKQRNNIRIIKEKIADYIDPPRFIPLIGPAQLHHAHYKCTIYYEETIRIGWPVPHSLKDEEAMEVLYIDHNHFHMVGNPDTGVGSPY